MILERLVAWGFTKYPGLAMDLSFLRLQVHTVFGLIKMIKILFYFTTVLIYNFLWFQILKEHLGMFLINPFSSSLHLFILLQCIWLCLLFGCPLFAKHSLSKISSSRHIACRQLVTCFNHCILCATKYWLMKC